MKDEKKVWEDDSEEEIDSEMPDLEPQFKDQDSDSDSDRNKENNEKEEKKKHLADPVKINTSFLNGKEGYIQRQEQQPK